MLRLRNSVSALALLGLCAASSAHAGVVGYTLDVTTEYLTGNPVGPTFLGGGAAGPDTGFFVITNNGTTTFNGTIGDVAVSQGPDDSFTSGALTLAPGASASVAIGNESSNNGGYNGPFGSTQPGVQILLNGNVTDGTTNEAVALSVFDADIHSGVPRTNPFGVVLDNYVLQGGDPLGRDTTDGFEETQAPGTFRFFEAAAAVPEPGNVALFVTSGLSGLGLLARKRRK